MRRVLCLLSLLAFGPLSSCAPVPRVLGDGYVSNDYGTAAVFAGTGAVLYAVDGGCKKAGCPSDMRCNFNSERCERVPCSKLDERQVCGSSSLCSPHTATCVGF
jgi:hypothetical protein